MRFKIAATVVFLSAITGAFIAFEPSQQPSQQYDRHAKFAVIQNGSVVDMSSQEFQMNAEDVKLEQGRSLIVETSSENMTWQRFLETMPVELSSPEASELCVTVLETEECGEGAVLLNGENVQGSEISTEISQGDTFLIVVDTESWKNVSQRFEDYKLPDKYKPFWLRGRSA